MLRILPSLFTSAVASAWVLAALACPPALAQRLPFSTGEENFSAEGLVRGTSATQAQCQSVSSAVWAQLPSGEAECIRYWASGLPPGATARALVYIVSDQLSHDQPEAGYTARGPKTMQALADGMQARAGLPFILMSRPGTFGSSGEHKQRRRALEPQLMSAAVDVIKARHGIAEFGLVGLSGGGHIVASLLGWRSDIACAVPTSSVSSPMLRWRALGRTQDLTGYTDSYEPVPKLRREVFHPKLRVFVLGDLQDSNTPWPTQTPLAERLRELGAAVELVNGEGTGHERHNLGASGQLLGAMCLKDQPTADLLEVAKRGLKG